MGKAAFLDLEDRSGRIQLLASADGLGEQLFADRLRDAARRHRRRRGRGHREPARRADAAARGVPAAGALPAPAARPAPRPGRRRGALPAALRRPDGQPRRARRRAAARAHDRVAGGAYLDGGGIHRGRDADPAAALRRRERAPVHDAPQRARPHVLPARRHRAVSQAADRGRARARLRARQGLPQRGRLVQAQPRVHDGRVVRGLRRLRRRHAAHRGVRRRERARRARHDRDHARRARGRHGAALAAQAARRGDPRGLRRRRAGAAATPPVLRAALVERGAAAADGDATWPQLVDRALSHFVEPASSSRSSSSTTRPSSRRWRARSQAIRRSSSATRRSAAAWSSRTATAS